MSAEREMESSVVAVAEAAKEVKGDEATAIVDAVVAQMKMNRIQVKGDETTTIADAVVPQMKRNRIQVSASKKPLFFYVNLAKRIMQQHNEVVLSALGMAIGTVISVAEILKNNGLATEIKILTSTVDIKDENKGRLVHKAKIEILLGKSENFSELMHADKVKGGKTEKDESE